MVVRDNNVICRRPLGSPRRHPASAALWVGRKARSLRARPGRGASPKSQKAPQLCSRSGPSSGTVKLLHQDRFLRCRRNELSRMFDSLNQHLLTFPSWEQLLMHIFPSVGIVQSFMQFFFFFFFSISIIHGCCCVSLRRKKTTRTKSQWGAPLR